MPNVFEVFRHHLSLELEYHLRAPWVLISQIVFHSANIIMYYNLFLFFKVNYVLHLLLQPTSG